MQTHDAVAIPRIIQCGGFRSLPAHPHAGGEMSDDARAGIAAHWLATEALRGNVTDVFEWADRRAPNGHYIDEEIIDNVNFYLDAVSKRPADRDIEKPGSFSVGDVTVNLRPDMVSWDKYGFYIDDFKNGWEIVEPKDNWTMLMYAFHYMPRANADTLFHMTIHQPRPFHPLGRSRTWTVNAYELHALWQYFVGKLQDVTTLQTGPKCYRCPALDCPALRKVGYRAMDMAEQAIPDALTTDELSYLKDNINVARKMLENFDHAIAERIAEAIGSGQTVRNYWLEPTEGALAWNDGVDETTLRLLAPGRVVSKSKPITPTQAKKFIPETIVASLSERKSGGLKLVRKDANQMAQQLFERKDT